MIVQLTLGDWSGDGHGQTGVFHVECNNNLVDAYKKGTKIIGQNFIEDVCSDYEDNKLQEHEYHNLKDHGFDFVPSYGEETAAQFDKDVEEDGYLRLEHECYVEIYLFICKLGDPELEIKNVKLTNINIGGYGMYQL